jgi:tetratricopeptide (TPR) repeat protein
MPHSRQHPAAVLRLTVVIAVGILVFLPHQLEACLWTYATDVHGHYIQTAAGKPNETPVLLAIREKASPTELAAAATNWKAKPTPVEFRDQNDYAVALIRAGELGPAIELLRGIERAHPNEYIVAANLGTAYELEGDVPRAIEWIRTGIERNPNSHFGTEWLHVKILEAKLELAKDPKWLQTHSVLNLDFGSELVPVATSESVQALGNSFVSLKDTKRAIEYQLHERVAFVTPPDPVVADLLESLANLYALQDSVEHAIPIYELAIEFGSPHRELIELRLANFRKLANWNPVSGRSAQIVIINVLMIIAAILLSIAVWLTVRSRARRRRDQVGTTGDLLVDVPPSGSIN